VSRLSLDISECIYITILVLLGHLDLLFSYPTVDLWLLLCTPCNGGQVLFYLNKIRKIENIQTWHWDNQIDDINLKFSVISLKFSVISLKFSVIKTWSFRWYKF